MGARGKAVFKSQEGEKLGFLYEATENWSCFIGVGLSNDNLHDEYFDEFLVHSTV